MFNLTNKESAKSFKTLTYDEAVKEAKMMTEESIVIGNIGGKRSFTETMVRDGTKTVYSCALEYTPNGEAPQHIKEE